MAIIGVYEDLSTVALDELEYTSLCEECASERDVMEPLSTADPWEWACCDDCGISNREEEEEEEEEDD